MKIKWKNKTIAVGLLMAMAIPLAIGFATPSPVEKNVLPNTNLSSLTGDAKQKENSVEINSDSLVNVHVSKADASFNDIVVNWNYINQIKDEFLNWYCEIIANSEGMTDEQKSDFVDIYVSNFEDFVLECTTAGLSLEETAKYVSEQSASLLTDSSKDVALINTHFLLYEIASANSFTVNPHAPYLDDFVKNNNLQSRIGTNIIDLLEPVLMYEGMPLNKQIVDNYDLLAILVGYDLDERTITINWGLVSDYFVDDPNMTVYASKDCTYALNISPKQEIIELQELVKQLDLQPDASISFDFITDTNNLKVHDKLDFMQIDMMFNFDSSLLSNELSKYIISAEVTDINSHDATISMYFTIYDENSINLPDFQERVYHTQEFTYQFLYSPEMYGMLLNEMMMGLNIINSAASEKQLSILKEILDIIKPMPGILATNSALYYAHASSLIALFVFSHDPFNLFFAGLDIFFGTLTATTINETIKFIDFLEDYILLQEILINLNEFKKIKEISESQLFIDTCKYLKATETQDKLTSQILQDNLKKIPDEYDIKDVIYNLYNILLDADSMLQNSSLDESFVQELYVGLEYDGYETIDNVTYYSFSGFQNIAHYEGIIEQKIIDIGAKYDLPIPDFILDWLDRDWEWLDWIIENIPLLYMIGSWITFLGSTLWFSLITFWSLTKDFYLVILELIFAPSLAVEIAFFASPIAAISEICNSVISVIMNGLKTKVFVLWNEYAKETKEKYGFE